MHIADGVLSVPVLGAGGLLAAAGVGYGLRRLKEAEIVRAGVLSSALFVASLVHVPVGPSSVHLLLNGLAGMLLGWGVFPALLVALTLQYLFFGYGGLTTLGVNTTVMALPGVCCYYVFGRSVRRGSNLTAVVLGFSAGALAIGLSGLLAALSLAASGREFFLAAKALIWAHVPVMVIEGVITGMIVSFLRQVRPEILEIGPETSLKGESIHA